MTLRQDLLQNAHVMVVGCGALGNEVLKNLTLLGIGRFTVVDFDVVEPSNLTRSILFRQEDVARNKVDVVSERIRDINPAVRVTPLQDNIAHDVGLGVIADVDVVMGCVDSRWARFMINRHCMRMGKPWVDGGITLAEGTARVFMPALPGSAGNCYACSMSTENRLALRRRMPCSNTIRKMEAAGHAPTSIITASVAGAAMAQEAVRLICGEPTISGSMFCYDADTRSARLVGFRAYDEDCPEHDSWLPAHRLDIHTGMTVAQTHEVLRRNGCDTTLCLRDDVFVDYIIDRRNDRRYMMMLPGRKVAQAMEQDADLRQRLSIDFYQHEYRTVGEDFPYRQLTLQQLGIPRHDVMLLGSGEAVRIR